MTLSKTLKPFVYDKTLEGTYRFGKDEDIYNVTIQTAMENIPPLEEEPFITTLEDFRQRMEFQLARQNMMNGFSENILSSWPEFNDQMLKNEYVGDQIEKTVHHRKVKLAARDVLETINEQKDPIKTLYDFVQDQVKWNEVYSIYADISVDKALDQKLARSGEMNMMFIRLLKEAGIEANPVLTSTRSHGKVERAYPVANGFNHLITAVKKGEKWVLIDASHPDYAVDLLPVNNLNDVGFMMNAEDGPQWINIEAPAAKERSGFTIRFDEDKFKVTVQSKYQNYSALSERRAYLNKGKEDYFKSWSEEDIDITSGELLSPEELRTVFVTKLEFEKEVDLESDFIYLNPFFGYNLSDNPFDAEKRSLPIDFPYPIQNDYIISIQLPENMEVVETPESLKFQLPNNDGLYQYQVTQMGTVLQIRSQFEL
ncbi:MAG: transglutaminase domain-containing protein, partial [Bacteroidota bacterium]